MPDTDIFKVINSQMHILDDGTAFPFKSSTSLHPEWPVKALRHVSRDVAREVQEALLALRDHATALTVNESLRCDTTPEIAKLAANAAESGSYAGFRTPRSYGRVRTKQEAAGLLRDIESGNPHCIRGDTLYQGKWSVGRTRRSRSKTNLSLTFLLEKQTYFVPKASTSRQNLSFAIPVNELGLSAKKDTSATASHA